MRIPEDVAVVESPKDSRDVVVVAVAVASWAPTPAKGRWGARTNREPVVAAGHQHAEAEEDVVDDEDEKKEEDEEDEVDAPRDEPGNPALMNAVAGMAAAVVLPEAAAVEYRVAADQVAKNDADSEKPADAKDAAHQRHRRR